MIRPGPAADSLGVHRFCAALPCFEERTLKRWYTTFPSGLPGVGLLLLRAAIGTELMIQGSASVLEPQGVQAGMWPLGLLAVITGVSFFVGFLTPLAGTVSALSGIGARLWHPSWDPSLASLFSLNAIVMATAITFLGPGALSLDAHFFGRRKIIIPRAPTP